MATKKSQIKFASEYITPDGHSNTSSHPPIDTHRKKELHTEMVPMTAWGSNVRDHVRQSEWDKIKEWCYKRAGYHCEICGQNGKLQGRAHRVEAHEIWHYDDSNRIQTLLGLIALCPSCHKSKHYGRAISVGDDKFVRKHIKSINSHWSWKQVFDHCRDAITKWQERSMHNYTLNMDYLRKEFGLEVPIHREKVEITPEHIESIKKMDNHKNFD